MLTHSPTHFHSLTPSLPLSSLCIGMFSLDYPKTVTLHFRESSTILIAVSETLCAGVCPIYHTLLHLFSISHYLTSVLHITLSYICSPYHTLLHLFSISHSLTSQALLTDCPTAVIEVDTIRGILYSELH